MVKQQTPTTMTSRLQSRQADERGRLLRGPQDPVVLILVECHGDADGALPLVGLRSSDVSFHGVYLKPAALCARLMAVD